MKVVYVGKEDQGKSLFLARRILIEIDKCKKLKKDYGIVRPILSNLKLSKEIYEKAKEFIIYWEDYQELLKYVGVTVFWDEISTHLSALKNEPLTKELNTWLRQGSKQGNDIYATAQELHEIHLQFRRRVNVVYKVKKVIGNERPGKNRKPVNKVWGLSIADKVDIDPYNEINPRIIRNIPLIPSSMLIHTKFICNVFDTEQVIPIKEEQYLEHIEKVCRTCGEKKLWHR